MHFLEVCPQPPAQGVCPVDMIWVDFSNQSLTFAEFTQLMPRLVAVLLTAWGIKQLLRLIFNR